MFDLLPLIIRLAGDFGPTLTRMLLGSKAGDVAQSIIDTLKKVFGTTDPNAIQSALAANPNLANVFIEALKADTAQFHDALADIADARKQTITLASTGSMIAWGAPLMSGIVTFAFSILMILWLFHPPSSDAAQLAVFNILVGSLSAAFGAVVQYWLGSSAGSREKDVIVKDALVAAQANVIAVTTKPVAK